MAVEYRILGPLEVVREGQVLDLGPRKQRSLLALLLIHANRVVSTDRILEELWGDDAAGKENALWVYVSRLRSILEPDREGSDRVIVTHDHGYALKTAPGTIDSDVFAELVAEGSSILRDDPDAASRTIRSALDLWRGEALQDFAYDDFAGTEITRLTELRLAATEDKHEADLRRGLAGELIGDLETFTRENPLRERPAAQLMLALYRAGRAADALRAFQRFRDTIGEELGIEPSPELARLEEQILLHDSRLIPASMRTEATRRAAANPFKGLRAFSETDADDFFGRDRLVAEIVRRIGSGSRLTALVGASGSGKSSAVRAGLIPAVRKGAVAGSDAWLVAQMVPGSHPFAELEAALLRSTLDAPDSLSEQLKDGDDGLLRAVLRILPSDSGKVLLVIDQFEELFTLVPDEAIRRRFLSNLLAALDDAHGRCVVLLTLRADFYGRPLEYDEFGDRLGPGVINVVPLRAHELEAAIEQPARRAGVAVQSALLAELVSDVVGQPGALPMLQYTLTELFDRRIGDELTIEDYHDIGGVRGALTRRAEDLYSDLERKEREAARQLFFRLVSIGDGNETSRRRVRGSEIASIDIDAVHLQRVIEIFGTHRLLTLDRDQVTGDPTLEVAHEALLSEWDRLQRWIEEGRADLRRYAALSAAAKEWHGAGRSNDYLFTGARLAELEKWIEGTGLALTALEQRFVQAAVREREAAETEQAARDEEAHRLRRRARTRPFVGAAVVLAVVAGALVLLSLRPGPTELVVVTQQNRQTVELYEDALEKLETDGVAETRILVGDLAVTRQAAEGGADIIVVDPGSDVENLATEFPNVAFVSIDDPAPSAGARSLVFLAEEGGYLAGVVAALASNRGIIGFHAPIQTREAELIRAGFEHGARTVDPNIQVFSAYNGSDLGAFIDQAATEAVATRLFDRGVDVIYTLGSVGAIADLGWQRWVIGGSGGDEWFSAAEAHRPYVLTSIVKQLDDVLALLVDDFESGGVSPGIAYIGLAGGYDHTPFRASWQPTDGDGALLDALVGRVVEGSLDVDIASDHLVIAALDERPDINPQITLRAEGSCTYAALQGWFREPSYVFGATLAFDFFNAGDRPAAIALSSGGQYPDLEARVRAGNPTHLFATLKPGRYQVHCIPDLYDSDSRILAAEFTVDDPTRCPLGEGRDDTGTETPVERYFQAVRDGDIIEGRAQFTAQAELLGTDYGLEDQIEHDFTWGAPRHVEISNIVVDGPTITWDVLWIDRTGDLDIECGWRATTQDDLIAALHEPGPP